MTRRARGTRGRRFPRLPVTGVALALVAAAAGCTDISSPESPTWQGGGGLQLVAFDSCGSALNALKAAATPYVGPYGFQPPISLRNRAGVPDAAEDSQKRQAAPAPGAAAPEDPQDHSGTNTHEAGVDEPDVVKTDGRRIVTVSENTLRVVDVASRKVTGAVPLTDGGGQSQLLLHGDHALVVVENHRLHPMPYRGPAEDTPVPPRDQQVTGPQVVLVDLGPAEGGTPRVAGRLTIEGSFVDARQVGGTVRLVTSSQPRLRFPRPEPGGTDADRTARNQQVVANSTIDDWLPRYVAERDGASRTGRVGCDRVSHPARYSGTSLLSVSTFDLDFGKGEPKVLGTGDPVSIVADGQTVYGTATSLYVANRWRPAIRRPARTKDGAEDRASPAPRVVRRTELYKFDISRSGPPRHVASGAVLGTLLNQYAMSEWRGHLRVATTTGGRGDAGGDGEPMPSVSQVTVLAQWDDRLVSVGSVGGMGRTELIRGVRFVGPVGYVVTFRQTDPLYTLDLRDPRRPKVVGELKITGYSAYLHPVDDRRLLGVGQEATTEGRRLGTQVSLFDVGDPARPTRTAQHHVRYGHSAAEFDPHAFLYWAKTSIVVVPVVSRTATDTPRDSTDRTRAIGGALVLRLTDGGFQQLALVSHPAGGHDSMVRRSLVVGDTLWTFSHAGLKASDAATAADRYWIGF